jgi:hypothetical protein
MASIQVVENPDGTFTLSGSDTAVQQLDDRTFRLNDPSVVMIDENLYRVLGTVAEPDITVVENSDGTFTISGSDTAVALQADGSYRISGPSVTQIDENTFRIANATVEPEFVVVDNGEFFTISGDDSLVEQINESLYRLSGDGVTQLDAETFRVTSL